MPRPKKNSKGTSASARLFKFKKQLHQYRTKMNTVMSLWNVVFSLGALWLVQWVETQNSVGWNIFDMPNNNNNNNNNTVWSDTTINDTMNATAANATAGNPVITFDTAVLMTQVSRVQMEEGTQS